MSDLASVLHLECNFLGRKNSLKSCCMNWLFKAEDLINMLL